MRWVQLHQLLAWATDMMGGKGWGRGLAPQQRRGWEGTALGGAGVVMGLLLLRCWEQGGDAEGKVFRAKEAEAFLAGKLGFFPCLSQNGCSGVLSAPFF